jgi:hypothetical protein
VPTLHRAPLTSAEQKEVCPNWPDYCVFRQDGYWWAVTNTGRPRTPYFWLKMDVHPDLPEDLILQEAGATLQRMYQKAHPNGCPKRH